MGMPSLRRSGTPACIPPADHPSLASREPGGPCRLLPSVVAAPRGAHPRSSHAIRESIGSRAGRADRGRAGRGTSYQCPCPSVPVRPCRQRRRPRRPVARAGRHALGVRSGAASRASSSSATPNRRPRSGVSSRTGSGSRCATASSRSGRSPWPGGPTSTAGRCSTGTGASPSATARSCCRCRSARSWPGCSSAPARSSSDGEIAELFGEVSASTHAEAVKTALRRIKDTLEPLGLRLTRVRRGGIPARPVAVAAAGSSSGSRA